MSVENWLVDKSLAGTSWHSKQHSVMGEVNCTFQGNIVNTPSFSVEGVDFVGGSISIPGDGTWFVGVELFSGAVRCLPRLGHRGWIPLAKVVRTSSVITDFKQIKPEIPKSRIPRTLSKILAAQSINVVVMGSSLTASGGAATDWPGMVFGLGAIDKYKIPGTVNTMYTGVGGTPNQYQLAQLGFGSHHSGSGIGDSGWPGTLDSIAPLNGRSNLLNGVDLVVIGCLANGGDYRLETIEPLIRKLRTRGVEVIMVTDNPQGPSLNYSTMSASNLYVDGPTVMHIADLYGVEVADTAGYVFDAYFRSGGSGIYGVGDTIHQQTGLPAGPNAVLPANGHEAWARAVRSIFSVGVVNAVANTQVINYDFTSGTAGWVPYSDATIGGSAGFLTVTKADSSNNQWGAIIGITGGNIYIGDTVTVQCNYSRVDGLSPIFGLQLYSNGGGWSSDEFQSPSGNGPFSIVLTASKNMTDPGLLLYGNWDVAPAGTTFSVSNLSVTVHRQGSSTAYNQVPNRASDFRPIPTIRMVSDLRTPADAFVTLPFQEKYVLANHPNCGTLGAHPWGSSSFSRKFASYINASSDLLTIPTGKIAALSGPFAVGFALIHYREPGDGPCTFDVIMNGSVQKTITIGTVPFANEWFQSVYGPTELNVTSLKTDADTVNISVTSGTLKIAALVALTPDLDYIKPEEITYVGSGWLPSGYSRSGANGKPTNTAGDYAYVKCEGKRVAWMLSANPGSQIADFYAGNDGSASVDTTGNYHVRAYGKLNGPGERHIVRCATSNPSGNQANGYALHIVGAVIINDR